jgi:hypothetical protein
VDEQHVIDAVWEYSRIFVEPTSVTAIRVCGGPVQLGHGRSAWLVTVEAAGAHLLVSVAVHESGGMLFGHLRLTP